MAIPDPLINWKQYTQSSYYPKYLEIVAENTKKTPQESASMQSAIKRATPKKPITTTPVKQSKPAPPPSKKPSKHKLPQKVRKGKPTFRLVDEDDEAQQESIPQVEDVNNQGSSIRQQLSNLHEVVGKGKAVVTEEQVAHSLIGLSKKKRTTDQFILVRRDQTPPDSTTGPSSQPEDDTAEKVIHESSSTSDSEKNGFNREIISAAWPRVYPESRILKKSRRRLSESKRNMVRNIAQLPILYHDLWEALIADEAPWHKEVAEKVKDLKERHDSDDGRRDVDNERPSGWTQTMDEGMTNYRRTLITSHSQSSCGEQGFKHRRLILGNSSNGSMQARTGKKIALKADLEGPAFNLVKAFHKNSVFLQYQMDECHKLLTNKVDLYNPEGFRFGSHLIPTKCKWNTLPLGDLQVRSTMSTTFFLPKRICDYLPDRKAQTICHKDRQIVFTQQSNIVDKETWAWRLGCGQRRTRDRSKDFITAIEKCLISEDLSSKCEYQGKVPNADELGLDLPQQGSSHELSILDSRGAIPSKSAIDAKVAIQEMAEYSQKWHNGTSRSRSTKTSDRLVAIQAQLNNLRREIKKVNKKVYAAQVGYEQCKGPHSTKDCTLKEEGKTLEEAYYTQFGGPFQGEGYRAAAPGFYQRNNVNPSYQKRRQSMEDTLSKFMCESTKRYEEKSNLIKEIRASTDATIRN
ncbi:hypothetical protein Tco_0875628 [Tanacetum coccineum]|uniref:Uncharacterized protein n=1 Tax=Tanacetum coccineum TaxID=301880 RepID=A0ABQ5BSU6_9ASTR